MKKVFLAAAFAALTATASSAAPIYGTSADLTGSRSEGAGIVTNGAWAGDNVTQTLRWDIVDNLNGTWTYTYSFGGFDQPGISHIIIDLTDDCYRPGDAGCVTNPSPADYTINSFSGADPANDNMPGTIIGVKINGGGPVFVFTSNRAPVWGDFYMKGGSDNSPTGGGQAWNPGLVNHASELALDFIARPNGTQDGGGGDDGGTSPEPATLALFGLGLVAAGRRLRR